MDWLFEGDLRMIMDQLRLLGNEEQRLLVVGQQLMSWLQKDW